MSQIYTLSCGKDVSGMADSIRNFLSDQERMDAQLMQMRSGEYLVQARAKEGRYKQWLGLDKTISVRMSPCGPDRVVLDIGSGKWVDKWLAMAVSMVVLWPLTVTSGIGMYKQAKLPEKITRTVEKYLAV